ncbi:MAG: NAD(+) diphosphatase [Pseudomonadota bacterium]
MPLTRSVTFATGTGQLDRAAQLRDVADDLMGHTRAALLPLHDGKVLIDDADGSPALAWMPPMPAIVGMASVAPVFLGLSGETPCFAAAFDGSADEIAGLHPSEGARFADLRTVAGQMGPASAGIASMSRSMLHWHLTHRFCGRCGTATEPGLGGWRRICPDCGSRHFPRTDPVVIMLILNDDSVLVGRQNRFGPGIYSLLAGFMEPGETIEDAVRRETREEAGIAVGPVGYVGCQPWPFASNLMIGCVGLAESEEITIDTDELEDAQWVSRAKMDVILSGRHPRIAPPRPDAIARAILTDWVNGDITLPEHDVTPYT